jgi:Fuc2NAc and GlcNAc transferase
MAPLLVSAAAFLAALWLTRYVREYAIRRQLLDIPNARSSHVASTPRGGGIAMVGAALGAVLVLAALGFVDVSHAWALIGGGALAAAIGFLDDHRHLGPGWRLAVHVLAAVWVLGWLGGMPAVEVAGTTVAPRAIGHVLAVLFLVWTLNLTNFMDGIDGIAAVNVVTVALGAVVLSLVAAPETTLWVVPLALAASAAGFLVWNWPPATIFMGDAGSGFLGLMTGALSLQAAAAAPPLFWAWLILQGVFFTDATVTLVRRLLRGDPIIQAHRMHAYQHAARRCGGHKPVTCAVAAINVLWLFPLALLVALGRLDGATGVAAAYVPLLAAAIWLDAGKARV